MIDDGELELEEEEEYEVERVSDNDWRGKDIDMEDGSDGDCVDLDCTYDVVTDSDDDNKYDIEVWYAKAKFFPNHINRFSRISCNHPGFALSID